MIRTRCKTYFLYLLEYVRVKRNNFNRGDLYCFGLAQDKMHECIQIFTMTVLMFSRQQGNFWTEFAMISQITQKGEEKVQWRI